MRSDPAEVLSLTVSTAATLREAFVAIDQGSRQIALVVDPAGVLIGTVTDGDVRRALLRGATLEAPISEAMQVEFSSIRLGEDSQAARDLMLRRKIHQIPVVDSAGRLIDLVHLDDLVGLTERHTKVFLMAGGLGTRLRPLTETVPKPMLTVSGKPILEQIISSFVDQGFRDFIISLNYKGEMIRSHFGDGTRFNARIEYVEESKRMGTAGALSLLPSKLEAPMVVMNGDLLTSLRFDSVLRFHEETGAHATMCARDYTIQVPFGVIEVDGTNLLNVVEKPTHSHLVNAGIYVLSPEVMDHIEPDTWLDMPTLFERLVAGSKTVSVFPIHEDWIDIGRIEDLDRARQAFGNDNLK